MAKKKGTYTPSTHNIFEQTIAQARGSLGTGIVAVNHGDHAAAKDAFKEAEKAIEKGVALLPELVESHKAKQKLIEQRAAKRAEREANKGKDKKVKAAKPRKAKKAKKIKIEAAA